MIFLLCAAGLLGWPTQGLSQMLGAGTRSAASFAGPSIVEHIEAAIRDCGSGAGTHYHLFRTTFNAFELNSAVIERFANNLAVATGGIRHAAVQENGTVRIHSLSENVFRPYSCFGKCAVDYRSNVNAPE